MGYEIIEGLTWDDVKKEGITVLDPADYVPPGLAKELRNTVAIGYNRSHAAIRVYYDDGRKEDCVLSSEALIERMEELKYGKQSDLNHMMFIQLLPIYFELFPNRMKMEDDENE